MNTVALEKLCQWISIPSISTDSRYQEGISGACRWLVDELTALGWEVDVHETAGNPVVVAMTEMKRDRPTVLVYGHYDVQPAENKDLWNHPPFDVKVGESCIWGRGASDNKGQIWTQITAISDLYKEKGDWPLNVILVVEGEEEVGSPNLSGVLHWVKDLYEFDFAVVSDTSTPVKGLPVLHYALRGIVTFEVELRTASRDLHSGIFGGTTANAVRELASLCDQLWDQEGKVVVEGFYDGVLPIEAWEKEQLERIPYCEKEYLEWIGAKVELGEEGYSTNERRWFRPTLEINGIYGGYTGSGVKTIVPARAVVKMSARLVASQDPEQMLESLQSWFKERTPEHCTLNFFVGDRAKPYLLKREEGESGLTSVIASLEKAVLEVQDKPLLWSRHGGTIPVVEEIRQIVGVDTLLFGLGNPDDAVHSPNEKFELSSWRNGLQILKKFYASFYD